MVTLGSLIETLSKCPPDRVVGRGFGRANSYRGDYSQIAFEPAVDVTVESMLTHARMAVGMVFAGYKGGVYRMSEDTECFIAKWGEYCGEEDAIRPGLVASWSHDSVWPFYRYLVEYHVEGDLQPAKLGLYTDPAQAEREFAEWRKESARRLLAATIEKIAIDAPWDAGLPGKLRIEYLPEKGEWEKW